MSAEQSFVIPTFDVCLCVSVDDPANPGEIKWVPCIATTYSIQAIGDANKVPTVEGFKHIGCFAYCFKAIKDDGESWEIYDAFNIYSAMRPVAPKPSFLEGAKRGYGHYVATNTFTMVKGPEGNFFVVKMEFVRQQAATDADAKSGSGEENIVPKTQSTSRYVQKFAVHNTTQSVSSFLRNAILSTKREGNTMSRRSRSTTVLWLRKLRVLKRKRTR